MWAIKVAHNLRVFDRATGEFSVVGHYLVLRRRGWYAQLNVPADIQDKLGRKKFRRSMKTRDRTIAEREAKFQIGRWQREIAVARGEVVTHDEAVAHEEDDALSPAVARRYHDALERAPTLQDRLHVEWSMEDHVLNQGYDNTDPEARQFYKLAFAKWTLDYVEEWITSLQVKPKTAAMRRSTLARLAESFPILSDINRRAVRKWIAGLVASGLAPATVQRMASDARIWYRYLVDTEVVPESEPFDRLGLKVPRSARAPWPPSDLIKLHRAAEAKDQTLADLIALSMYSGARLGELVNLKVEDVEVGSHFRIVASKTEAGVREVPIAAAVKETFARLAENSQDGYILSGIAAKNRTDTMSKAFRRLRKAEGYTDPRLVLHSIRHTVVTLLEEAGVPEATVASITGHRYPTMTFGLYSGGVSLAVKRDALDKLAY